MLSATQPRRRELLTPGVVRHLPRCRLFPLIAPAARFGRGPGFDRFDTKPIRFVAPARVADRPARLAAPAHMRGAVPDPIPSRRRKPRWPIPRSGPSHRARRIRPGPSWLPGLQLRECAGRARFVAVPPPVAGRTVLGRGARARFSTPRVSTPPRLLLRVSTPVSTPPRRLVPPSNRRACRAAARRCASAAAPRLGSSNDCYQHRASDAPPHDSG